ncbi:aminoglycoside 6'-N-acetyltransferase [Erythrobacter donghaensis]|uniref:aminoglycoside 6'-N-acetyltransferase n=1 Tax=Erythrobacter donghaensis TaxID=267135 RepID=UPI000A36B1B4|nr:aminoglycoside 6'-N-acetyltransferase [Erythrobacter donghaensis]
MKVREATAADLGAWSVLRAQLWPDDDADAHAADIAETFLTGDPDQIAFLAEDARGRVVGFVEASIRHDYVNGCDTSPVAFGEGAFILPEVRGTGIGRALAEAVAEWGRARGCAELASDALLDNTASHGFHAALGFEETERVVFFRRRL